MELAELGGKLLADTLPSLADGTAVWIEQDEALVTHAAKISKQEMRLDPHMAALDCVRHVLASSDTAPARCVIAGKTVRRLEGNREDCCQTGNGNDPVHAFRGTARSDSNPGRNQSHRRNGLLCDG